jgi:hypothetical protein
MSKARDLANAGTALGAVTATELGYVDGVTSAIQTQIDAKIAKSTVTAKGDLLVATGSGTVVAQAVGTDGQYLQADSAQADGVKWSTLTTLPSQTGNSGKFLTTDGSAASWATTVVDRSSSNWFEFFLNDDPSNTNNQSSFSGITKDSSGNIYTVGSIGYTSSNNKVLIITKTNSLGEQLLGITLGLTSGSLFSQTERIALDSSGNIYVSGGFTDSSNLKKGFVAKLTSAGAVTWTKTFDSETGTSDEWASGLGVDSSGNVYVSGSYFASKNNPYILKLDSSGTFVWARRIVESNANGATIQGMALSSSYIYIYGQVYRGVTNGYDMFVVKYDLSGTLQWKNYYSGTGNTTESALGVTIDASDNTYVVGTGLGGYAILMKLDSSGAVTFSKRLNTTASVFYGIHLDSANGHLYAVGYVAATIGSSTDNSAFLIVKYDTSGNIVYQRAIKTPSTGNSLFNSIVSGSYLYFCGYGRFANYSYNAILGRMNIDGSGTQSFQVQNKKLSFETVSLGETSSVITVAATWTSGTESALTQTYGTYSFNVDPSYAATSIGYF